MPKCKPMDEAYAAEQVQENNVRQFISSSACKMSSGRSPPDWNSFGYDQDFYKRKKRGTENDGKFGNSRVSGEG